MTELVQCQICFKFLPSINNWHLQWHNITLKEYKRRFPDSPTMSEAVRHKLGNSTRGKKRLEFSKKISGQGNGMFRRKHEVESIQKMRKNRKGKGQGISGKYKRTLEIREKISKGVIKYNLENYEKRKYIKIFKSRRGTRSKYRSRTGCTMTSKSNYELSVMIYLDMHPEVIRWDYEPFRLGYRDHNKKLRSYTPDFFVEFSGIREIWEIKPQAVINSCDEFWHKMSAIESSWIQELLDYHQIKIISDDEVNIIRKIDWEKLYQDYGFSLEDYNERIREMAENVTINDIPYKGQR
jgi:hypothetical protein